MIDTQASKSDMEIGQELYSWLRRHWVHLLVSPLVFLLFTVVHECAHVFAAAAQGATITDFSVLPTGQSLGYMNYQFPEGSNASHEAVSVAPYALWSMCMVAVLLLSLRRSGFSFPLASSLFLWGFIGAWGDIAIAGFSWLDAGRGDWSRVLGESTEMDVFVLGAACVVVGGLGYWVQRRLYRDGALSLVSYGILVGVGSLGIFLGTSILQ